MAVRRDRALRAATKRTEAWALYARSFEERRQLQALLRQSRMLIQQIE
jgi:hypothetical protein